MVSSLIIRLANYSITTSPIYNKIIRRCLGFQCIVPSGGFSDETLKEARCCDNHLSQGQMIIQAINLLRWISSGNFTRELDKESLLN